MRPKFSGLDATRRTTPHIYHTHGFVPYIEIDCGAVPELMHVFRGLWLIWIHNLKNLSNQSNKQNPENLWETGFIYRVFH
jgi:hypothetical protein